MDTAERRLRMLQSSGLTNKEKKKQETFISSSGSTLRFFLALIFFLVFYVFEQKDLSFLGITGEKIYETVCENAKGFDFVLDIPYTLND